MPRQLKNLIINEVSSVDRGAGDGVKVLLMKRADAADVIIDFNTIRGTLAKVDADKLDVAVTVLRDEIASIQKDAAVTDKEAAVADLVKQFNEYVAGLAPAQRENAMPTDAELKKQIDDAVSAAVTKANEASAVKIAKLEFDALIGSLPDAHKEFCKAMSDEDKKKFAAKKPDERDAEMADAKKRAAGDPVVKLLTGEVEDLKKRLAISDERDAIASFAKRAKDLGLPEAHGEIMRKAYGGNADAIKKHEEVMKGLIEQVRTGKVFAEFGTAQQGSTSAYDSIQAKAAELRKADPKLTIEQAFDKAYNDPANVELREQHKAEEMKKRQAA